MHRAKRRKVGMAEAIDVDADKRGVMAEAFVYKPSPSHYNDLKRYLPAIFEQLKKEKWNEPCAVVQVPPGSHIKSTPLHQVKEKMIRVHFQTFKPIGRRGYSVCRQMIGNKAVTKEMPISEFRVLSHHSRTEMQNLMVLRAEDGDLEDQFEKAFWRLCYPGSPIEQLLIPYAENLEELQLILPDERNLNMNVWGKRFEAVERDVPGITTPTTYVGSFGSAFPLHTENSHLYAANVQLEGETKIWYVAHQDDFPKVVEALKSLIEEEENSPDKDTKCPAFWSHQRIMINPEVLAGEFHVRMYRIKQQAGQLVLLRPKAFHQGINMGMPVNSALNFTGPEWLALQKGLIMCTVNVKGKKSCPARISTDRLYKPSEAAKHSRLLGSVDTSLLLNTTVAQASSMCHLCEKDIPGGTQKLENHRKTHTKARPRPYPCGQCRHKCLSQVDLKRHVVDMHTERAFKCDRCPLVFARKDHLKCHLSVIHSVSD